MFKKIAAITALAAMAAIPMVASAGNESANLTVNATVVADCHFDATSYTINLSYDFVNPIVPGGNGTGSASGNILCSPGLTSPTISFNSAGAGSNTLALSDGNTGDTPLTVTLGGSYAYNSSTGAGPLSILATVLSTHIGGPGSQNVAAGTYSGSTNVYVNF